MHSHLTSGLKLLLKKMAVPIVIGSRMRATPQYIGEMAEWSNAAVLKTVEGHTSGGSNPSFSAKRNPQRELWVFVFKKNRNCFWIAIIALEYLL